MAYSQVKAMLAITKGSLKAMLRSPSTIIFSVLFPFIFILIFGFLGGDGGVPVYKIAIDEKSDTVNNPFYDSIKASNRIRIVKFKDTTERRTSLIKGKLAGVLTITKLPQAVPAYSYQLYTTTASSDKWPQLLPIIDAINGKITRAQFPNLPTVAIPQKPRVEEIRPYKTIDFILPGQLGFSLLSSGVFGVAFMFFNLRNTLVLKRFFATPISKVHIVLGEGIARVIFQMLTAVVIILVGRYFFGFTLIHGWITLAQMLVLSFIGLLLFMGFGFIVSGLAKTDSSIPPFANLITMPQFLLGGTFFEISVFPTWLQPISKALPLTHLNTALRAVAFEGQNLWAVKAEIGYMFLWIIVLYAISVKVFKWE
jgi:ABC-2 type transport system permease protein